MRKNDEIADDFLAAVNALLKLKADVMDRLVADQREAFIAGARAAGAPEKEAAEFWEVRDG